MRIKKRMRPNENFLEIYAQNTFVGAGGVLLIGGTLDQLGYESNFMQGLLLHLLLLLL